MTLSDGSDTPNMSLFNLDRFRYAKSTKTPSKQEQSPESEKENKPATMKSAKIPNKTGAQGVIYIDSDSESDAILPEPKTQISLTKKSMNSVEKSSGQIVKDYKDCNSSDKEDKIDRILEMFPQLTRNQVQKVIESTSTLDGAVAACLLEFGDHDQGKKRKQDGSCSSHDSSDTQPTKRRKSSGDYVDEEKELPWEKQEAMVRRLQKKFPDQDKEELRLVLQEHDWNVKEALQVLQIFSDSEYLSFSPDESKENKKESLDKCGSSKKNNGKHKDVSESEDGTNDTEESEDECDAKDCKEETEDKSGTSEKERNTHNEDIDQREEGGSVDTEDSEDDSEPEESTLKLDFNTLSTLIKRDTSNNTTSSCVKASPGPTLCKSTSGTSLAKNAANERKKWARASDKYISSEEDDEEDPVSSDFEDFDVELETKSGMTDVKREILTFFSDATIDELMLISGCSVKKAQKIDSLRPFDSWESLVELIHKDNGLSENILSGSRVVLKERKVVLSLMSKCETISSKLIKQVTEVMESGTGATKKPKLLNSDLQLKPYQIIGLKWLMLLHEHKLSCILADEMGLGKTIQAIAFIAQLYENGIQGPHLITVPASTLDNWVRELKLWCPSLNVIIYYGTAEDRRYLRHDILNGDVEFDVIVTTYNLAIGNDSDRSLFRKLPLTYAVFDEGHMLKNMNTLRYRHLMAINAKHRLLLTGTPLQNNLLELMSLLNFIMPSMFSSTTTELSKMFSMKSHEEQSRFERDRISQAKLIMKPFILRRLKNEVLKQLPAKEEKLEFCPMSDKQKQLYQTLFTKLKSSTNGEKRELCNVMMQLRKMANHPLLHRQYYTTEKLQAMSQLMLKENTHLDANPVLIQEDMEVMSDFELHCLCKRYYSISSYQLETSLLIDSGKFKHLTGLLSSLKDKGDRVVLFSQFTMMLDIVEVLLKHLNHRYVRLDGSTPIADRIGLIDNFNTDRDIFVFLLSTRAGGLGINLTSANVVILHDIDWNPYNDKQAEDRCHRVGQTKTVQVIKLISKDTIEDCILQLGQKKLKLEQDMTTADDGEGTIPEDMATLLKASLGL